MATPKSTKAEIDRRVHEVAKLIASARPCSYILRFCSVEWGVGKRQAETYLQRARELVKQDYSIDRAEFLASRLAILDKVAEASLRDGQHSNAIGAVRLQSELSRLLGK